ncbi:hypothetical protein KP509_18G060600 [Ceratopteris richardii]|uniref:Uncharacterized protein n=1 Tax=Ceratopteris richardii TaxID=49495 RepID=A0A8T2SQS9_CERRI|nr:hypothetical protein KP509_18G060600 [Ceratopteris richardii]
MGLRASLSRTSFKAHQRGWSSGRAPVFRWSHLSQNADITTQIRSFYPSISSVCSLFFVSLHRVPAFEVPTSVYIQRKVCSYIWLPF